MVLIDVRITKRVHELARLQAGQMAEHVRQQRVAGDVEWHTKQL